MKRYVIALLIVLICVNLGYIACSKFLSKTPIEFVVIVPTYNNEKFVDKNLSSILRQKETYPYFKIICVNDCSTDKTGERLDSYVKNNDVSEYVKVIHNPQRRGATQNWYDTIHALEKHEIVVCVDGDDALRGNDVLYKLAKIYESGDIWMTYGNYVCVPNIAGTICRPFPDEVIKKNLFRGYPFISSHLRTFYAGLFQLIKEEDFTYNNQFLPVACDVAMMFPMLEMSSLGHIAYIPDILYEYTASNPISDFRVNLGAKKIIEPYLLQKPKYHPLQSVDFIKK